MDLKNGNSVPAETFGNIGNFAITGVNAFGTSGKPMAGIHGQSMKAVLAF